MTYGEMRKAAADYYALCRRAERLGIPTSLDDPRSPTTVAALADAVSRVERAYQALGGRPRW